MVCDKKGQTWRCGSETLAAGHLSKSEAVKKPPKKLIDRGAKQGKLWA